MKNKIAALVMALVMAFSFAACDSGSDGSSSEPETVTVTETVPAEPTTPEGGVTPVPVDPTTPSLPESPTGDEEFPKLLKENTDSFDNEDDGFLIDFAKAMCQDIDAGATFDDIANYLVNDVGYEPYDSGFFIGAGVTFFCPENSHILPE